MSNGEARQETLRRGQIWWANLSPPAGSEPGGRRPVLVIQADPFNRSRIATTIVAAITSNMRLADAPGNVELTQDESGLPKASVINVSQLATVDRRVFIELAGTLTADTVAAVDDGVRLVLGV